MADFYKRNSSPSGKIILAVGSLIFLLSLSLVGCSNSNDDPEIELAHTEQWTNPNLKGENVYHATYVRNKGTESCQTCHGTDLNGGNDVPGCSNICHFSPDGAYSPSGSEWEHAVNPHGALLNYESVCNECHSILRGHDLGPPACHDCHDIAINHTSGRPWLDPKSSGFHGRSTLDCAACHNLATECGQCHFGSTGSRIPAEAEWSHGYNEIHANFENEQSVCNFCHVLNRVFGNPPAKCHDCHGSGVAHPLGQAWLDFKSIEFHGSSNLNCAECHDLNTDCNQCHFGPDGSFSPVETDWTHGYNEAHKNFEVSQAVCNRCHALNQSYANPPADCHNCHDIAASHPVGQTWLDPKNPSYHGQSNVDCAACHDLNTYCAQCHFDTSGSRAPAGSGWTHGFNDAHQDYSDQQDICNACHDLNRSYGNPPTDCHDCHGSGLPHPLGQAWLDVKSIGFHGESGLNCSTCHNFSQDCTQCHFGADGSKAPAGSGWMHGYNSEHKTFEGFQGVCNTCHDVSRSYGNPPAACHDCHGVVLNHSLGQTWLDKNSSSFHGGSALNCAGCHNLSTDCGQCHFGSSGSKAPAGSGWNHGLNDRHEDYESYQGVCTRCHNLNRTYGNDPNNCHDCHGDGDGDDD